ncbi:ribonuclease H2 subunit A-like [Liolophura sinensis]|uniref:ribonuclease H2 subunit A-like n=1 Tax=Liolophura sinensis TaxID=3198878 RepID=UPI003158A816
MEKKPMTMEVDEEIKVPIMDQSEFLKDNTRNCLIQSTIADILKTEPCWLGIDEAGRGPVLGPMVYGTCFSPINKGDILKEMGFADSKTLNEEQRDGLFEKIKNATDVMGWMVDILSPAFISNSMLRRIKYNLNALSHDTAIGLIRKVLSHGVNVTEIYVDTVGDPAKYQAKLKELFPDIDVTVAKKADSTYPIVSAASICAKVARDQAVKSWQFSEGIKTEDNNYGSGYPSDPATKKFMSINLDRVFGFPQFVRFSWSTASQIMEDKGVPVLWEDDDEDENTESKGMQSLFSLFGKKEEDPKLSTHSFFKERSLQRVQCL